MTAQAMMRPKFRRPAGWSRLGESALSEVRQEVARRMVMALTDMHQSILETPVYTGSTLVNYRWSIGAAVEGVRKPVETGGKPGTTSKLPLGSEPRRAANQAQIDEEFHAMLASVRENPFQDIFLVNNKPNFTDIEYGTYAREGKTSRTPPGGMTRRGETLFEYDMMGYVRRVS